MGRRAGRVVGTPIPSVRYRVHRLDLELHPTIAPAEAADEPDFAIDARPDKSFRLVVPRSATAPPQRLAVRLKELTIHKNRALMSTRVRLDAMVLTVPGAGSGEPYHAHTERFDRIGDGDTLPFDDLLIYEGPAGRFLDIAVWVARDEQRELDLAELVSGEANSYDVKAALALLAGLAVAAPAAAAVAGSVAAVATLVRTGARLLDKATGRSIGVYRTSLLPHERFGAGQPARRHPDSGGLTAQDMSFAFEVIDLD